VVVAQSDWLDFEVRQSTPEQRKDWFEKQRARVPGDAGEFVGDFLPSLLADAPDPRGLQVVLSSCIQPSRSSMVALLAACGFFEKRTSGLKF